MGRNPRIEFEGAVYHVMSRGNRQEAVFLDDHDNRIFLDALAEVCVVFCGQDLYSTRMVTVTVALDIILSSMNVHVRIPFECAN